MPRVTRRSKRSTGWNETTTFILRTGRDYFGQHSDEHDELDLITLFEAWTDLKTAILPAWLADHAGTRPWGWWQYDCPKGSRRERTDGGRHPFDDPRYDLPKELFFGCPRFLRECDMPANYETEHEYLARLSLLTVREISSLKGS